MILYVNYITVMVLFTIRISYFLITYEIVNVGLCVYNNIYVYIYIYIYIQTYICMNVCMYVSMYVCMYVYIYIYGTSVCTFNYLTT